MKKTCKGFPTLEWLAVMCSHIQNRGEQMVRYYGYYSNVLRGKRQEDAENVMKHYIKKRFDDK